MAKFFLLLLLPLNLISCTNMHSSMPEKTFAQMQTGVKQMMDSVSDNIYKNGAIKWLYYFENANTFYMANDGKLVFPDYASAVGFINDTLVKMISKINLQWKNVLMDSLTSNSVNIHTFYHEDLTTIKGNILHEDGYCTAIADHTSNGWKFRNLHWSSLK